MKKTKLEEYLAIVTILIVHGPLQLARLESLSGVAEYIIREDLSFLIKQGIVKESKRSVFPSFVASPLGVQLFKYFGRVPREPAV